MIPKSGNRFSDKIMREQRRMIPKSGNRFSDKIMREQRPMIPKSGNRFLDKIMREQRCMIPKNLLRRPRVTASWAGCRDLGAMLFCYVKDSLLRSTG